MDILYDTGRIKEEGVLVYSIQAHFTPIIVYKHPCMGTVEPDLAAKLIGIVTFTLL